jgi:hypothetical protein
MHDGLEELTQRNASVSRHCSLAAIAFAVTLFSSTLPQIAAQNTTHTDPTEHIRGVVINSLTHEPIGRALVFSPDNSFATMTDDRGRFEFTFTLPAPEQATTFSTGTLGRGFQNPTLNRPGELMARKVAFVGPNFDQPMNVNAFSIVGPDQQDVIISLLPEARVVGHVNIPGSDGSDKIQVALYRRTIRDGREQWDSAGNATTRADGQFRMAELSPGDYKLLTLERLDRDPLTAFPRGQLFGYRPLYYPNASDFATAAVIRLAPGETFQATMSPAKRAYYPVNLGLTNTLALANGIAVTVWPEGHPGPGYSLGYNPQEAAIQGSLPDGTYTVQVRDYGPTMMAGTTNFTVRGAPVAGPAMTLVQGTSVTVSVREEFQHKQTEQPAGPIFTRGPTAVPQNTRRPNYLQVSLAPDEQFSLASQVSLRPPVDENDESLVIENVLPGRYRVSVNTGLGYVSAITSGSTDLLQKPLVVGAGGTIPALEITVRDDGAELDGTLDFAKVGPGRQALQNRWDGPLGNIYVIPTDKMDSRLKVGSANGDGTFTIQQIAPGTYHVFATDGRLFQMQSVSEEWLKRHESEVQVLRVVAEQKEHLRLSLVNPSE